ncbi:helix-turn-helix domain-containing protein [Flavihumibacter sp. UBA7668]
MFDDQSFEICLFISGALDCGYADPAYFDRVFKQEFGKTPQEWKLLQI